MKKSLRLVGLVFSLVATHSFAEMLVVDESNVDPLAFEFGLQGFYVGSGDVERGSLAITNFEERNFLGRALILPRTKVGILRLGAEYKSMISTFPKAPRCRIGCSRLR